MLYGDEAPPRWFTDGLDRYAAALTLDAVPLDVERDKDRLANVLHEVGGEFCHPFTELHPIAMHRSQAAAILGLLVARLASPEPREPTYAEKRRPRSFAASGRAKGESARPWYRAKREASPEPREPCPYCAESASGVCTQHNGVASPEPRAEATNYYREAGGTEADRPWREAKTPDLATPATGPDVRGRDLPDHIGEQHAGSERDAYRAGYAAALATPATGPDDPLRLAAVAVCNLWFTDNAPDNSQHVRKAMLALRDVLDATPATGPALVRCWCADCQRLACPPAAEDCYLGHRGR